MAEKITTRPSLDNSVDDASLQKPNNKVKLREDTQQNDEESLKMKNEHDDEDESHYPHGRDLALILLAMYLAFFLVALDRTIISTAIPRITDDFNSLGDVGWYASAYLITGCSFQLMIGKIYTLFNPKVVLLSCIGIFEAGSALCGAAPNSTAFIIGRAIAGAGGAGVFSGGIIVFVHIAPLHKRPMLQSSMGALFGIASVIGPLLGGAFTENPNATWRWCFYLNLPIGGLTLIILTFILKIPSPADGRKKFSLRDLDPIGTVIFLPALVCLLLALQWGGTTYAWSSARIIVLLVISIILLIVFICLQAYLGTSATVPPHVFTQRSIAAGSLCATCIGATMLLVIYYLPLWFQAIHSASPVRSGILLLPTILALVLASIFTGATVTKTGYYAPFLIGSVVLCVSGISALTTLTAGSPSREWIGFQVIYGLGIGMGMQMPSLAAQTVLSEKDVPTGVSLMFFWQSLGGAIATSAGGNVFGNELVKGLRNYGGVAETVLDMGATEVRKAVPKEMLEVVLEKYSGAITTCFYVGVAFSSLSAVGAGAMEWRSVKKKSAPRGQGQGQGQGQEVVEEEEIKEGK